MSQISKRIVAEICCNWPKTSDAQPGFLWEKFEKVIAVNAERGFELESWKLSQLVIEPGMEETIIAVFIARTSSAN